MNFDFSDKEKILLLIYSNEENQNFDFFYDCIESICKLTISITERIAKEKVPLKNYEEHFETHFFKFTLQTLSLNHLFKGTPVKTTNKDLLVRDISSIFNCSRSLMEVFLTINYLYFNNKSEEQTNFRRLLYIASGLNNRQAYPANDEDNKNKKEREKQEIELIKKEIINNNYFSKLPPKKQKYILKELKAHEIEKKELIKETGLENNYFHTIWRLFSNYSHSEYLEAIQLRDYLKDKASLTKTIFEVYRISLMLNSFLIIRLTERFEVAKEEFDKQDLREKTIIEHYIKIIRGI